MVIECGRRSILSHFVQSSMMLPLASTTTMQCSQRASTPSLPLHTGLPADVTGPTEALRHGTCATGNEMLGPTEEYGTSSGRFRLGISPRSRMKTRLGLSAYTLSTAPYVHFSWSGKALMGFGQFASTS